MYHDNICYKRVVFYTNTIIVVITVLIIEGKISFLFWCILNWAPTRPNKEEYVGCDNKVTNICLVKNWLIEWWRTKKKVVIKTVVNVHYIRKKVFEFEKILSIIEIWLKFILVNLCTRSLQFIILLMHWKPKLYLNLHHFIVMWFIPLSSFSMQRERIGFQWNRKENVKFNLNWRVIFQIQW